MQLAIARLNRSLRKFIHAHFSDAPFASEEETAVAVSTLLDVQSTRAESDRSEVYDQLADLLKDVSETLSLAETASRVAGVVADIRADIASIDRSKRFDIVAASEQSILQKLEVLIDALGAEARLDAKEREQAIFRIAEWDFDRIGHHAKLSDAGETRSNPAITQEALTTYLRDRFQDPDLQVTAFSISAAGGLGKQTLFFESTGKLTGSFVLRRDRATPLLSNDCHLVAIEYPVLRAVSETGFPAPEAVWLDVEHPLLPGGNFFVMRRSPGAVKGTVFGGTAALPRHMVVTFANAVGQLHRIEPLVGLGDLNDSIRTELWSLPLTEVVRSYITGYRDYFLSHRISNVPALAAAFNWLLSNVPECDERPVLVHGDLGLHNLLFDGDELRVVLDWEQAHIGDPIEDLGYIRNTANTGLDWPLFVEQYETASGMKVDRRRLHFQQVWSQIKNATGSVIAADLFSSGQSDDFGLAHLGFIYYPIFLGEAMRMIEAGPDSGE